MRAKFVAGNWKMNTTLKSAEELAGAVVQRVGSSSKVQVALCPPFPYLAAVARILQGSPVALGAQNCYEAREGAFTGEVSPVMLLDVGCRYVILGHSERRHKLGENDAFINRKVRLALEVGLSVILCIGETLAERESNSTENVLDAQITAGLAEVSAAALRNVVIAYEPVWAIGTGRNATPDQAQQAHAFIRQRISQLFTPAAAQALLIQYGGSVTPENAASLLRCPDVDGALVGGASLKADKFLPIVQAGAALA